MRLIENKFITTYDREAMKCSLFNNMYCLYVYLSVLDVLAFICTVYLSCHVDIVVLHLTLPSKREDCLSTKPGSTQSID